MSSNLNIYILVNIYKSESSYKGNKIRQNEDLIVKFNVVEEKFGKDIDFEKIIC